MEERNARFTPNYSMRQGSINCFYRVGPCFVVRRMGMRGLHMDLCGRMFMRTCKTRFLGRFFVSLSLSLSLDLSHAMRHDIYRSRF